ncbi:MAG TPA: pantetheine-phosphate adenylyltransferase [Verrucomicrobia bacterium]|nr:pantetheine-phosphate adenylyltransferase [Verrucomicrobiales bacterium]HIL54659.1 pantetheine-phosphate adenylyltransferase [Verrucomicrobiota bacterium]
MSSPQKKAVYAGSFDPLTNGHLWMIKQGLSLFDHLTVAIGINPEKNYTYGVDERLNILKKTLPLSDNLDIAYFENLYLVDYATEIGASYILRGIRSAHDYEFERGMRHTNSQLKKDITTVFLMPPRDLAEVSSSMVKGLIGPEGWEEHVAKMVPPAVFDEIKANH